MKQLFKSVILWLNAIKTAKNNQGKTDLELKIEEAEQKHRETGKRYHVLTGTDDKFVVVDNAILATYNRMAKKRGVAKIDIVDLLKMSHYSTK